jgi:RNA polymerase sigma factor (sigma-70 family)
VPLSSDPEEGVDPVEPSAGPGEELEARERERAVTRALLEIDPALREVVILHDYHGLDHKESAAALGVSHEAVRKRYSRALAELGRRLKGIVG